MAGLEELQAQQMSALPDPFKYAMGYNDVVQRAYDYLDQQKNNALKMQMNQMALEKQKALQQAQIDTGLLEGDRANIARTPEMLGAYRDLYTAQAGLQKNAATVSDVETPNKVASAQQQGVFAKMRKAALENPTPENLQAISQYVGILNATDPEYLQQLGKAKVTAESKAEARHEYKPIPYKDAAKESELTGKTIDQIYQEDYAAWQLNRPRVSGVTPSATTQPTTSTPSKKFFYGDATPEEQKQMDALIAKKDLAGVDALLTQLSAKYGNSLGGYKIDVASSENPLAQVVTHLPKPANSAREARYADVVAIAGNEAQAAIKNLVTMPVMASSGFFGEDTKLSDNIFAAPVRALKKTLSKEYTNSYNAEVDNIGAFYARLINGGLSTSQADIDKFTNQYRIKQGEDGMTAMTRFAQMRQAFERAAEVKLASKATPPEQMAMWEDAVKMVKDTIPITVEDVNKLRNQQNPTKTFADLMKESKGKVVGDTVTVGDKSYTRPANMTDKQWSDYKNAMGVK